MWVASCGMLATNTVAQGDTRETGLDRMLSSGLSIPRAVPGRKGPAPPRSRWPLSGQRKGLSGRDSIILTINRSKASPPI